MMRKVVWESRLAMGDVHRLAALTSSSTEVFNRRSFLLLAPVLSTDTHAPTARLMIYQKPLAGA
eukprot:5454338-Amphidinium_carterae.1